MKVLLALCFILVHVWADGEEPLMDHASFEATEDDDYDCDQEYFLAKHEINYYVYINDKSDFVLFSVLCKHEVNKAESRDPVEYSDQLSFEYRIYRKGFHLVTFRKKYEPLVNSDRTEPHIIKALKDFKTFKADKEKEIVNSILIHYEQVSTNFYVYFSKHLYVPKFVSDVESDCFKISFFMVQKETNGGYQEMYTAGLPEPVDEGVYVCEQLKTHLQEATTKNRK